ncbi:MAG TPA: hypothetical protein DHV36_04580 [Desulfobacteraceae bacterium]|nr:hypothetical protein [Desulfobacteraceae bacterium]
MKTQWFKTIEDLMVAVTFAEQNQHGTAIRMMGRKPERNRSFDSKGRSVHQEHQRPQMRL